MVLVNSMAKYSGLVMRTNSAKSKWVRHSLLSFRS